MPVLNPLVTIQPGDFGIDFSGARPLPLPGGQSAQPKFVQRYIAGGIARTKVLDATERDWLHRNGYPIVLTYEWANTAPNLGWLKGFSDGLIAAGLARSLGYPTTMPIVIAVDLDSIEGYNLDMHEQYVRAFAAACTPWPIGIYGDTDIMRRVLDLSVLNWRAASSWWSRFLPKPSWLHVLQGTQDPTHQYDKNTALLAFPAWLPHWEPDPIITPPPTSLTGEDDMSVITNDESGKYGPQLVSKWTYGLDDRGPWKRHIATIAELNAVGNPVGNPLTDAELDSIRDWTPASPPETQPVTIDYDLLAANIAVHMPKRYNGSIELTAAG